MTTKLYGGIPLYVSLHPSLIEAAEAIAAVRGTHRNLALNELILESEAVQAWFEATRRPLPDLRAPQPREGGKFVAR